MKKLLKLTLFSLLPILAGTAASAATIQMTLSVAEDAYVQQHDPLVGNGSAANLYATQGMADGNSEKIYLLFDASDVAGQVVDIVDFRLVFTNQYGRAGHAYLLTGPGAVDWTESTINYENAPANNREHYGFIEDESIYIAAVDTVERNQTAGFLWTGEDPESLKALVIDRLNSDDRKVAIGILRDSPNRNVGYASKEHATLSGPHVILEVLPDVPVRTVSLDVAEDAHISQSLQNLNFGSDPILYATQGVVDSASEKIYLKFDASGLERDVIHVADLQAVFLTSQGRYGQVDLLTGPGINDWSEHTITYSNAPANDPWNFNFLPNQAIPIGQLFPVGNEETAGMAWHGGMQETLREALNTGNRVVTLGISRNSTNGNLAYASKEHEEFHAPRLVLLIEGEETATGFTAWQASHFSPEDLGDASISGPEAAPAGDNVSNLLKYALGLDPWVPSAHLLPQPSVEPVEETEYLTLSFRRPTSIGDVSYQVEALGNLTDTPEPAVEVSVTETGNGVTEYTYRDTVPVDEAGRRFLRLRVSTD